MDLVFNNQEDAYLIKDKSVLKHLRYNRSLIGNSFIFNYVESNGITRSVVFDVSFDYSEHRRDITLSGILLNMNKLLHCENNFDYKDFHNEREFIYLITDRKISL